jgi:hypothetical protein
MHIIVERAKNPKEASKLLSMPTADGAGCASPGVASSSQTSFPGERTNILVLGEKHWFAMAKGKQQRPPAGAATRCQATLVRQSSAGNRSWACRLGIA